MKTRLAKTGELDAIYLMGLDIWADGPLIDYLQSCHESSKYKTGTWYVLENKKQLLSSLIVYDLGANQFGIGSIATPPELRKNGYAGTLITDVINLIESKNDQVMTFLYSDIKSEFYEKFGFKKIPLEKQKYQTTTCMVKGKNNLDLNSNNFIVPNYF